MKIFAYALGTGIFMGFLYSLIPSFFWSKAMEVSYLKALLVLAALFSFIFTGLNFFSGENLAQGANYTDEVNFISSIGIGVSGVVTAVGLIVWLI